MNPPEGPRDGSTGAESLHHAADIPAERTRRTVERFRTRLTTVALLGLAFWSMALPVPSGLAFLCHASSLASALRAFAVREPFLPAHLGHLDEAAWFFLVGHASLTLAGR